MYKPVILLSLLLSILFICGIAEADHFKVLIVISDSSATAEATALEAFTAVGGHTFEYEQLNIATGGTRPIAGGVIPAEEVDDGNLNWFDYQILWFAWNAPGHDGDYFLAGTEEDLLTFVENGGVIYVSAFDDNFSDQNGKQIGGWMPIEDFPCLVDNTADSATQITEEGKATTLFSIPNELNESDLDALVLDDNFAPASNEYVALANRTDNGKPAIMMLPYGKGAYVGLCIDARSTFPAANPVLENMLYYIANLTVPEAVEPVGKLQGLWGGIKSSY